MNASMSTADTEPRWTIVEQRWADTAIYYRRIAGYECQVFRSSAPWTGWSYVVRAPWCCARLDGCTTVADAKAAARNRALRLAAPMRTR